MLVPAPNGIRLSHSKPCSRGVESDYHNANSAFVNSNESSILSGADIKFVSFDPQQHM